MFGDDSEVLECRARISELAANDTLAQGDHEVLDVRAHLPVGSLEIAEPEIVGGLPVMLQGGGEALNFQM